MREIEKFIEENKDLQYIYDDDMISRLIKDAYNLGVQDAADNAECETGAIVDLGFDIISATVNKESILKLKL
jgi:hypothetical protein